MKLVILESPYAGEIERNVTYARRAIKECLKLGESPIASHLLFTQEGILNDLDPAERALGIAAGIAWASVCDYAVFYEDYGYSKGMVEALKLYNVEGIPTHFRQIGRNL